MPLLPAAPFGDGVDFVRTCSTVAAVRSMLPIQDLGPYGVVAARVHMEAAQ